MSPQENRLLQNFLQQLLEVKVTAKDPEAAALIARAGAAQPDAVYLLVQRALLQDQAMQAAQQQIAQLQAQLASLNSTQTNSFFGNSSALRNENSSGRWGHSSASAAPAPVAAAIGQPASSFFGGNAGNLLGTVAATAAGVAAGAFLFQGLGSLMGAGQHGQHASGAASAAAANGDTGLIPNSFADDSSTAMQPDSADDMGDFSEG